MVKLMLAHHMLVTYDWLDALEPHIPFGLSASTSGATFVEITSGEADKGAALARLCARLGVDRSATVAFGDQSNDLGMLRWAGRSFAMDNAHSQVLGVADEWILQPEDPWEVAGYVHNVVFTCGAVPEEDGTVKIYWGGADTVMCAGTARIDELVGLCRNSPRPALGA